MRIGIGGSPTRSPLNSPVLSLQAQLIAQSIGQAFSVAYQEFLRANGINPEDLSQKEYSDIINTQEMYNDDLIHFSNSENCKEVGSAWWCTRASPAAVLQQEHFWKCTGIQEMLASWTDLETDGSVFQVLLIPYCCRISCLANTVVS